MTVSQVRPTYRRPCRYPGAGHYPSQHDSRSMLFLPGSRSKSNTDAQAESAGCICRARHRSRATREDSHMSLNRRFHVMRTIPLPSSVVRRGARHPVGRRLPYVAVNSFSCLSGVVREPRRFSFDNSSPSRGAASTLLCRRFLDKPDRGRKPEMWHDSPLSCLLFHHLPGRAILDMANPHTGRRPVTCSAPPSYMTAVCSVPRLDIMAARK